MPQRRIWKFRLEADQDNVIVIPRASEFLEARGVGRTTIEMWYLVDRSKPRMHCRFYVAGTGQQLHREADALNHVATVFCRSFVWHVFDMGQDEAAETTKAE